MEDGSCQDEALSCHYYCDMAAGGGGSFLIRRQPFEKLVPQRSQKKGNEKKKTRLFMG